MKLKFSIVAEREIEAAADHYEIQQAGLGLQFIEELNRATKFILQFPDGWFPISQRVRRCFMRRFPYSVIYSVEQGTVTIVTVVHQSRDPVKCRTLIMELGL